jgi:hypothetical protein
MGLTNTTIELSNFRASILHELNICERRTTAKKTMVVSYVGARHVHFKNRTCCTETLMMRNSVKWGAVSKEDMGWGGCPRSQTITVNLKSPNVPTAVVKKSI